jgi:hypothetical protein
MRLSISSPRDLDPAIFPRKSLASIGIALLLAVVVLAGCGIFNPDDCEDCDGGGGGGTVYPPRNSPENAILYLKAAWENKDSVRVDSVYAEDYLGTSVWQSDPGGSVSLSFAKTDEVRAVGGLYLDQQISNVTLDFKPPSGWQKYQYSSDPPSYIAINIPYPKISVTRGETTYEVTETTSFEFTLKPVASAPDDTLWEIIRWNEVRP